METGECLRKDYKYAGADLEERQIISRIGTTGKGTHYILKGAPKGQ
jgi:hypothetical protein